MISIFLDSDILLDALLSRSPFDKAATALLELVYDNRCAGYTSAIAMINTHYFLNKNSITRPHRIELLKKLRTYIKIISVDDQIIDNALNSKFADFEDAVQYYAAVKAKCEYVITRNSKDYRSSNLSVLDAEQLINLIV